MTTYLYELPTTGAISFSDFCVDKTASYAMNISDATQARANLRAALKESKRAEGEKDFLRLVVDEYLPHLYGIKACFDAEEIVLSSEPVFSWRSTLSANLFNSSPRQSVPSLHADLAFTLLTYAFVLSNLARSTVTSLGNYEFERTISEMERKTKDEKLNFAVTLLCRANGVFKYLSETVLPEWDKDESSLQNRPPDATQQVTNALAKMSLADAQQLAIRKLLSKSAFDSTLSPGPPLPKSHPSPSLIAKLFLECSTLYASARALAKTPGREGDEVAPGLRHYLADAASLCSALAHKWLGVDAGENGGASRGGVAVAFLGWAKTELEELRDGRRKLGGVSLDKDKREIRGRMKDRVTDELDSVVVFWKHYKKMNDSLHFQPVPPTSELQSLIPAGRAAVASKPFVPPVSAFGPRSVEYVRHQAELLELSSENASTVERDQTSPDQTSIGSKSPSYAGAGSYF
ncbi:uncharacterized protein FOMMEDRAFT_107601 [Fomitiporia mediterranea MF3/22]|uniref:uncharacterized protein n=1 Tax=Fomitiporia mediterranea (strain MF3/22) TaxID=694068 RepID=UPI0004409029|nr:uncharacterized protein FOMMEDRAFT_107601 [Fomitiporia mediterranea MF3/22]EJD02669.1 hypothetical protein FOMMEDRAFT_107601 [Fomitiporia mediterranea MF3/22]